jgi:hypothetical protein
MDFPVLEKEALLLRDSERALLADRLLAGLQTGYDSLRQKWIEESESRLRAYESGLVSALDGPETMASLRAKFAR